ncbi:MAG TPA: XdhC family protein [Acidimicrobiales bacterium]
MNPEIEARAAELRRARVPFVQARVVRAERPTSAKPGDQAVVLPDGSIEGFVGGACAESTVRAQGLSLLDSGVPLLLRISPEGDEGAPGDDPPGTLSVVNHCLSGGTLEIFLEPVVPAPLLAIHGESPIASALLAMAGGVGFRAVEGAAPPPAGEGGAELPAAVVVASHGRGEEAVLEAAVRAGVPYVGLVASRKRGEAVLGGLDLDEAQRGAIHTPAGLDIGARTPQEVALSILAEIVSLRLRPTAAPRQGPASVALGERPAAAAASDRPQVATDLVCGMSVVTGDDALHLDHGGERYWFCGSGCLRAFAADPGAYLAGAGAGAAGDRAASDPSHPRHP